MQLNLIQGDNNDSVSQAYEIHGSFIALAGIGLSGCRRLQLRLFCADSRVDDSW